MSVTRNRGALIKHTNSIEIQAHAKELEIIHIFHYYFGRLQYEFQSSE